MKMKYSLSALHSKATSTLKQRLERSRLSSLAQHLRLLPAPQKPKVTQLTHLWHYNCFLMMQTVTLIRRLQDETSSRFRYPQVAGPHIRHIIEHYQALSESMQGKSFSVAYDKRQRDLSLQGFPDLAAAKLQSLLAEFLSYNEQTQWRLNSPLCTTQRAGAKGEFEITVETTLGRELLSLASHTIHHHALLRQIALDVGIDMGEQFGKAPATLAHQRFIA
jgi:hypothetical protein